MKQMLLLALACHILVAAPAQSPPTFKWVKYINFVNAESGGEYFDFYADPAGNSYVYGVFHGALNFGGGFVLQAIGAVEGYFIAKYDPNGQLLWAQKIVAPNGAYIYDADPPSGITADLLGNVYICGQLSNPAVNFGNNVTLQRGCSGGCSDFFVVKYNSAGEAQWAISGTGAANTYQTAPCLVTGSDNSIFVAGNYGGQSLKVGSATASNNLDADGLYMTHLSTDGQAIATWFFSNGNGSVDMDHLAITADNKILATGSYDEGTLDFGNGVQLPTFGGNSAYNFFVVEYNDQGTAQWARNLNSLNNNLNVFDIAADTLNQPYVLVNYSNGLYSNLEEVAPAQSSGQRVGILLHLIDSTFHPVANVEYSGFEDPFSNLAVDRYNRFFVVGAFTDPAVSVGDAFFENMNSDCDDALLLGGSATTDTLNWVRAAGGGGCEGIFNYYYGRTAATDQLGNLYAAGSFGLTLLLDSFTKSGDGLFVSKIGTGIVGTHEPAGTVDALDVFPNPSQGSFSVTRIDPVERGQFILYDAQGRVCYRRNVNQTADLDFRLPLPAGVYTLEWRSQNKIGQQKVVITK